MQSREQLEQELADYIISALQKDIHKYGTASMLVSGGSTPVDLFKKLSKYDIEWDKVNISLVDERYLPHDHHDQNGLLVKTHLIKDYAANALFLPLVLDSKDHIHNLRVVRAQIKMIERPFTLVILGMGEDGHTASLFPDALLLDEGMALDSKKDLIIIQPKKAPYQRITFTRKALLNTENLILHCYGIKKKNIIERAKNLDDYRPYPIQGFINQDQVELKIFWTE